MAGLAIGLLVASASILMVFLTYFACQALFRIDESLNGWVQQHGYRIIAREDRQYKWCPTCYITVEDRQGQQKRGLITVGTWYIVGFKENITVLWEE